MAALTTLGRRIDRHVKDSNEKIEQLKTDFEAMQQTLRGVPKLTVQKASELKVQKASVEPAKRSKITRSYKHDVNRKTPAKPERDSRKISVRIEENSSSQYFSRKTNFQMPQQEKCNDEIVNPKQRTSSFISTVSEASHLSETDSIGTKINFIGSTMRLSCSPLKLIPFLLMDLKSKLSVLLPAGN